MLAKWVALAYLALAFTARLLNLRHLLQGFDLTDTPVSLVILGGLFWALLAARRLAERPRDAVRQFAVAAAAILLVDILRELINLVPRSSVARSTDPWPMVMLLLLALLTLLCDRFSRQGHATIAPLVQHPEEQAPTSTPTSAARG